MEDDRTNEPDSNESVEDNRIALDKAAISEAFTKENMKHFFMDFLVFFKENAIVGYLALIFGVGGLLFILMKVFNLKLLSITAYLIGCGLMLFLLVYSYRDWAKKRERYMNLEEKMDKVLDELVEDEEFQEEFLKDKKGKRKRTKEQASDED